MIRKTGKYFIAVFVLTELVLRIIRPSGLDFYRKQKQIHRFDETYFIDLEENAKEHIRHFLGHYEMNFSTNERGFRATATIDRNKKQIGCIGDSVVMGFGVNDEETFCYMLNGDYNSSSFQAVNMGVDAYGPAAIAEKLKRHIPGLNLKLLYYFPTAGDDIDNEMYYKRKHNALDYYLFKIQFLLTKYSYAMLGLKITQEQIKYRVLETFLFPLEKMQRTISCSKQTNSRQCQDVYSWSWNSFFADFTLPQQAPANQAPVFADNECSEQLQPYPVSKQMMADIESIVNISRSGNIKLVFVLAPTDIETAWCSQRGNSHRFFSYLETLEKYLIEKKLPYINLNQYTRQMQDENGRLNPRPYYIIGDGHYTSLGNKWVAKILKEKASGYLK